MTCLSIYKSLLVEMRFLQYGTVLTNFLTASDSKSINLKVIRQETLYSLQVVRCVELIDDKTSQSGQGTSKSETATGNIRLVMFPASQSEQMNLKIGTEIKICPPW